PRHLVICSTAGPLLPVFLRAPSGSPTVVARQGLSTWVAAAITALSATSCNDGMGCASDENRTSVPICRNTCAIPVSWQIGRLADALSLLLIRICEMAFFA